MKKRLQAILAAFMAVFLMVSFCTPFVGAVAPIALVEAALVSYVASTGYKLYIDNGTGSDLLGLMSDTYDVYLQAYPEIPTLLALAQGGFVYNDNSGNIIITQTAANAFQGFADWIKTNYNVSSSGTSVVPGSVSDVNLGSFVRYDNATVTSLVSDYKAVFDAGIRRAGLTVLWSSSPEREDFYNWLNQLPAGHCVSFSFYLNTNYGSYAIASLGQAMNIGSSYYFGDHQGPVYRAGYYQSSANTISIASSYYDSNVNNFYTEYAGYFYQGSTLRWSNINATAVTGAGLAMSLANNVIDKSSDVTSDKVLVYDVGASAGDTAEEIAQTVVIGYDSVTGTIPVTDTIVATEVIDTPVQEYPDFNNLGLPELGLALVERFPFCIPYDFVHLVSLFDADPVAPYIEIDLFPQSFRQRIGLQPGQAVFTLDMTSDQYAQLGVIMRWGSLVGFCVGLMFITKRLIWTS